MEFTRIIISKIRSFSNFITQSQKKVPVLTKD